MKCNGAPRRPNDRQTRRALYGKSGDSMAAMSQDTHAVRSRPDCKSNGRDLKMSCTALPGYLPFERLLDEQAVSRGWMVKAWRPSTLRADRRPPIVGVKRKFGLERWAMRRTVLLAAMSLTCVLSLSAQQHNIDTQKSTLTIHVGKTGALSGLGHEHEVRAPVHSGTADTGSHPAVEVHVDARALRVIDKGESEKDRAEVQKTMLGPEVLDSERRQEVVAQVHRRGACRPGRVDPARESDTARADATGYGARCAKGRPVHRRDRREADRFRDQTLPERRGVRS